MLFSLYAGIVTFDPEINRLRDNILSILQQVEKIIIVDNGSQNLSQIIKVIEELAQCELICNYQNNGIACALNQIMSYAHKDGIKWVLLLDQDSLCPLNLVEKYKGFIDYPNVAVITPRIHDINNSKEEKFQGESEEITRFITSGSLNSADVWSEMRGFDEKLFIDMVDYDYAFRLCRAGYRIIRINSIQLTHEIGEMTRFGLGPFTICTYNHSAFRKYYITRNSLYISYIYPEYCNKLLMRLRILKRFFIVIFFENDKKNKVLAMKSGYRDYRKMIKEQRL